MLSNVCVCKEIMYMHIVFTKLDDTLTLDYGTLVLHRFTEHVPTLPLFLYKPLQPY